MTTEKESIVSKENYEISKKLYYLFKKYKDYDFNIENTKVNRSVIRYNHDELFNNKKGKKVENCEDDVLLVEVKEKWYKKFFLFIKKIFKDR